MKILGIIPARYGSTRFPGKPLTQIAGKPMIQWTYENASRSRLLDELLVATDDLRIAKVVESFRGKVAMTSPDHPTGTDRLIEVVSAYSGEDLIVVNIQGDEPGIDPQLIDGVVQLKLDHRDWEITTAACPFTDESERLDPNRVKVVFTAQKKALYFSRSLIPSLFKKQIPVHKHLGIYCYEKKILLNYNSLPPSELEASESLEQLRALEAGLNIGVYITNKAGLSVDVPEDVAQVERELSGES